MQNQSTCLHQQDFFLIALNSYFSSSFNKLCGVHRLSVSNVLIKQMRALWSRYFTGICNCIKSNTSHWLPSWQQSQTTHHQCIKINKNIACTGLLCFSANVWSIWLEKLSLYSGWLALQKNESLWPNKDATIVLDVTHSINICLLKLC